MIGKWFLFVIFLGPLRMEGRGPPSLAEASALCGLDLAFGSTEGAGGAAAEPAPIENGNGHSDDVIVLDDTEPRPKGRVRKVRLGEAFALTNEQESGSLFGTGHRNNSSMASIYGDGGSLVATVRWCFLDFLYPSPFEFHESIPVDCMASFRSIEPSKSLESNSIFRKITFQSCLKLVNLFLYVARQDCKLF